MKRSLKHMLAVIMVVGIICSYDVAHEGFYNDVFSAEDAEYVGILIVIEKYGKSRSEQERRGLAGCIHNVSLETEIEPALLLAVILVESSFRKNIRSKSGAIGLMQLLPDTAETVVDEAGVPWQGSQTLKNAQHNVRLGAYYLRRLLDRFDNDIEMAITAYNAGPTRTMKYVRKGRMYSQTYTKKVLRQYRELSKYFI